MRNDPRRAGAVRVSGVAGAAMALLTGLSGCASVQARDTQWLVDGRTTRAEALQRLGEPAQYYQGGYILAYRFKDVGGGKLESQFNGPVGESVSNLILVFGADRVLLRHSRVVLR